MITDDLKGITDIEYNHLNLPRKITFDNLDPEAISGSKKGFVYIYDATGVKLQKKMFDLAQEATTKYAGNYTYLDDNLEFFNHPEGYIEPVAGTSGSVKGSSGGQTTYSSYSYVFQYFDHLGNVRLSYSDNDLDGSIDLPGEIVEESNYYPFGLKHKGYNYNVQPVGNDLAQRWKYNGIELNEDLSINLYEMDLRQYDPAIGRWTSIDPVVHFSNSTYNGFDNNPVFWADLSGADVVDYSKKYYGYIGGGGLSDFAEIAIFGRAYGGGFFMNPFGEDWGKSSNESSSANAHSSQENQGRQSERQEENNSENDEDTEENDVDNEEIHNPFIGKYYGRWRHLIGPDAIIIGKNFDIVPGLFPGTDITILGYLIVLRGDQAGERFPITEASIAFGFDISTAYEVTALYYTGPRENITVSTFLGPRDEVNLSLSLGIDIGRGKSISYTSNGFVYGDSYSIGVGVPINGIPLNGNVNFGITESWEGLYNSLKKYTNKIKD